MNKKLEKLTTLLNANAYCFALLLIAIVSNTSYGQSITWEKVINEPGLSYITSIIQTPDEGYIGVGVKSNMYIVRLNKYGDTLWTKTFNMEPAVKIIKTNDNNYAICGIFGSFVKIDANGNVISNGNFKNEELGIHSIVQAIDDTYYICGEFFPFNFNPYLARFDSNGNFMWDTIYTKNIFGGKFQDIVNDENDYLVLTGYHYLQNGQPSYLFLMKTDQFGNQIWINTLTEFNYLSPNSMIKTKNRSFVIACRNSLVKFDGTGEFQWKLNYDTLQQTNILSITNTYDNNYVYSSWLDSANTNYVRLRKTDTNGIQIWQQKLGYKEHNNNPFCIRNTKDSGFIVAGRTDFSNEDPYFLKTNNIGTLDSIIGINTISNEIPSGFDLYQNFPNPFNPVTNIQFDIPNDANVTIKIYDLLGREVFSVSEYKQAGSYEMIFDGSNLASGLYFYSVKAETSQRDVYTETKKMVLIK